MSILIRQNDKNYQLLQQQQQQQHLDQQQHRGEQEVPPPPYNYETLQQQHWYYGHPMPTYEDQQSQQHYLQQQPWNYYPYCYYSPPFFNSPTYYSQYQQQPSPLNFSYCYGTTSDGNYASPTAQQEKQITLSNSAPKPPAASLPAFEHTLGNLHPHSPPVPVGSSTNVHQQQQQNTASSSGGPSRPVHLQSQQQQEGQREDHGLNTSLVRQRLPSSLQSNENSNSDSRHVDLHLSRQRRSSSDDSSDPHHSPPSPTSNQQRPDLQRSDTGRHDVSNVQNRRSLRRCGSPSRQVASPLQPSTESNHHQMGPHQDNKVRSSPCPQLGRNRRTQLPRNDPNNSSPLQQHTSERPPVQGDHSPISPTLLQTVSGNGTTDSSLLQKRSYRNPHRTSFQQQPRSTTRPPDGQTQGSAPRFSTNNDPLCSGSNSSCSDVWDPKCDSSSLEFASLLLGDKTHLFNINSNSNSNSNSNYNNINNQNIPSSAFAKVRDNIQNNISTSDNSSVPLYFNTNLEVNNENTLLRSYLQSKLSNQTTNKPSSLQQFSLTKQSHSSTLPTDDEKSRLPLHLSEVKTCNMKLIKQRLLVPRFERLQHVLNILWRPGASELWGEENKLQESDHVEKSFGFLSSHSKQLCQKGICEPVNPSRHQKTQGSGRVFVVKETKVDNNGAPKERLRFIFWPYKFNEWCRKIGYQCKAGLHHISFYLDSVLDEVGATGDAASGFFQVNIPEWARPWYRFKDEVGDLYQMTRLPMGISPAVEIMQTIMEVIIGNPSFVSPPHQITYVRHQHAYVDDIRIAGREKDVTRACQEIMNNCAVLNVTLKNPPSPSKNYVFLGANFNHQQNIISIGPKLRRTIPMRLEDSKITGKDLNSLVGRLIHAAGMLRLPLASYAFALKWCARKFNQMNNGTLPHYQTIVIPPSILNSLNIWCTAAHSNKYIYEPPSPDSRCICFVDASLKGWGATLITPDSQVFHTGGAWKNEDIHKDNSTGIINILEAKAFRNSVASFIEIIIKYRNIEFRIDNTSVENGVRRGTAHSLELNQVLRAPLELLTAFDVSMTVLYVKSAENLADAKSRLETAPNVTREMAKELYTRKGAGGNWLRSGG